MRALLLNNGIQPLRLQNKGRDEARPLRLGRIRTDPMSAPGRLVEAVPSLLDRHRVVVHLVQEGAGEHVHGDEGAVVRVRRTGCPGAKGDFHAQNALVGRVEELVFVEELEGGEGTAGEMGLVGGV